MAGLPPRPNFTPAPTAPAPLSNKVEVKHCVDWLKGACTRGDDCRYHHDPRLDPNLRDLKGPQLPSGPTCRRCADLQRPCDKEGRGGLDDPCSECRWYGGEGCACVLYALSLNDALWGLMVTRRKQGFNLPEFRARNYFNFGHGMGKDGQKPKPMPTSELKKDGWVGETQAQLEAKGDMLLPDMRKNPRKYLDPPVVSKKELGKEARLDKIQKRVGSPTFNERKRNKTLFDKQPSWQGATLAAGLPATNMFGLPASNAFRSFPATQNASAGNFPPAALNGRPSMESTRGVSWAETITWSYSSSRWVATTWCEPDSLAQQRVPPQQVEDLQFRPVRHSLSGAATLATWSYVTRRWTIKWADDTSMESAQYGQSVPPVALGQFGRAPPPPPGPQGPRPLPRLQRTAPRAAPLATPAPAPVATPLNDSRPSMPMQSVPVNTDPEEDADAMAGVESHQSVAVSQTTMFRPLATGLEVERPSATYDEFGDEDEDEDE